MNLAGEEIAESAQPSLDDSEGGGIYSVGALWLSQGQLFDNRAETNGGALSLPQSAGRIHNVLFSGNQSGNDGAALAIGEAGKVEMIHATIASSLTVDHAAVWIDGQATLTNSIITQHANSILASETAQVSEDYNLFFANSTDRVNLTAGTHSLVGDPGFVDSANGDYQLTPVSLAVNMGIMLVGVAQDLVGTARPQQSIVDIGTYESSYAWPQLSIGNASLNEGNEGISLLTLPVTLSFAKPITITVHYASSDGSATSIPATVADHDYAASSGMLTFAPMQTAQVITVGVQGDTLFENDEAFSITLGDAINATILQSTGVATILNDDAAASLQEPEKTNTFKPRVWLPFVPR